MNPMTFLLAALLTGCGLLPSSAEEPDDHDAHGEHGGGHDEVALSPEAVQAARLRVAEAEVGTLAPELSLPARIALDPRREALLSAWIGGQVNAIKVRTGDTVTRHQLLGTVQSPELGKVIAAYRAAKAQDEAADARLERLRRLEADGVASRSQLLDAEATHAEAAGALEAAEESLRILGVDPTSGDPHAGEHYVSQVPVRSPIAGKVLATKASVGRRVEPGDTLFHVGDLSEVWLLLDVYEKDLSTVAVGQTVRFTVEAWPGERFEGVVEQVADLVEPETRTVEVRVVVPNEDGRLKPNMFAKATLTATQAGGQRGVLLPAGALQEVEGREVVFVREEEGHYEARPIEVVSRNSAQVLISDGVEAGEPVVIEGAFALKSELAKSELGEGHAH